MKTKFFLQQRCSDADGLEMIVEATKNFYPQHLLPNDSTLYIVRNGRVIETTTPLYAPFNDLNEFIEYIENSKKKSRVVSFGFEDFKAILVIVSKKHHWKNVEVTSDGDYFQAFAYEPVQDRSMKPSFPR